MEVLHPDGTTACANSLSTEMTCSIDVDGIYTLLVRDAGGPNIGTYSVERDKI